jgi:hypothetical protein
VQHRIRKEPQSLKILWLVLLVAATGEVAHHFEPALHRLLHPPVHLAHPVRPAQVEDEDVPLLVPHLQSAELRLLHLLPLQTAVLRCLEHSHPIVTLEVFILLILSLLGYPVAHLPVQPLLDLVPDLNHLPVLHDALGQLQQELLLRGRTEVPVVLGLQRSHALAALLHVAFSHPVDHLQEDAVGVLALEDEGEITVNEVAQHLQALLGLVGEELVALDGDAVSEETDGQRLGLPELVDAVVLVDLSPLPLRVQPCVELLDPAGDGVDVYLPRQPVLVVALRDGLLDLRPVQLALRLPPHPPQPVLLQVLLHLHHLLLQPNVLLLQSLQSLVLLARVLPETLQKNVFPLQLLYRRLVFLNQKGSTLSSSRWFLSVSSTALSLADMDVSRSFSPTEGRLLFCLGGSLIAF